MLMEAFFNWIILTEDTQAWSSYFAREACYVLMIPFNFILSLELNVAFNAICPFVGTKAWCENLTSSNSEKITKSNSVAWLSSTKSYVCWLSVPHVPLNYRSWYTWFEIDLQEVSYLDLVVLLYCKKWCPYVITIFQEDVLCSRGPISCFLSFHFSISHNLKFSLVGFWNF